MHITLSIIQVISYRFVCYSGKDQRMDRKNTRDQHAPKKQKRIVHKKKINQQKTKRFFRCWRTPEGLAWWHTQK